MITNPGKLSRFWQELKRRRVVHVITVYATSAFVIIELINNLAEPLHLPPNLLTIVVIILAVGFPLAAILSWLYDLTGQGMERTKPLSESEEVEKPAVPNAWKIATYISFAVIAGLLTFNLFGGAKSLKAGDIQSLLILPFDNFTGDNQLDYVAAGMHSALIGDMGQISALRVISQTTANVYKTKDMSLPQIADEINMQAVIEPSVMCYGDSVCVQIRVITMYPEEKQLWVAEYKEEKSQILNLYNRLTKEIANDLMVEITPREEQILSRSRTINTEAYDSYLKGSYFLGDLSPESLYKAREYLNKAIEKNPDWAPLYAALAQVWGGIAQGGYEALEIAGPHMFENLNKALELDPDNADSHKLLAFKSFLIEWNWEKAETAFLKALAANPNNAEARIIYAQLLNCLQRNEEALAQGRLAIERDPLNPLVQIWYGAVLSFTGDFETALAIGEKVTADDPGHSMANNLIENAAFACGEYDKVLEAVKYILPAKGLDFKEVEGIYGESGFVAAYEEIMRQLEVLSQKEYIAPTVMACRYMMVDGPNKALEWLEKGFEVRDPNMPYIATHGYLFEPLFDNPRFIDILEKMNLPPPVN